MLIDYIGVNAMDALFWTAVINGFLAPPLPGCPTMIRHVDRGAFYVSVEEPPPEQLGSN